MGSDRALPSGVVSFVMTDIEGSTTLLRALGSEYPRTLERHRAILREVWTEHRGVEVDAEGDSFLVAFTQPRDALAACAQALRRMRSEGWGTAPVVIRVGAHLGPAKPVNGRYAALAVHQTARIADAANGGQALLSPTIAQQSRRTRRDRQAEEPNGFEIVDLGRYRVRDFDEAIVLYALRPTGIPAVVTAPRAKPAESSNLPNRSTELIGRRAELERLDAVVEPGRIVTLLGPGGVGKTKVATEFARGSLGRWPDGAWLIQLAPLTDERAILEAIANALSISLGGAGDPLERLLLVLRELHCLLIFDSCEHVRPLAGRIADAIRRTCASVAILTTSRVPLSLGGEQIVRVAPLRSGPDDDGPAVRLFEARAHDIDASTVWPRDVVARLCDRLDGLPLAIELAAARTDAMRPAEILRVLDRHDGLLRSDDPTVESRHRSIDATIDWSYDLLSATEQTTLRRLAVFESDFDLDDAIATARSEDDSADAVAADVWSLVANSMLARVDRDGSSRYLLLTTVRHRVAAIADRHELADAARRAAASLEQRTGPRSALDAAWLARVEVELANIRGLVARRAELDDRLRMRLVWTIGRVHDAADRFSVGAAELREAIDGVGPSADLAGVLVQLADLHLRFGDTDGAEAVIERAANMADGEGEPPWDRGGIAQIRADIAVRRGQFSIAEQLIERALTDSPSPRTEAWLWSSRGFLHKSGGHHAAAIEAFEHAREAWRAAGTETRLAKADNDLAGAYAAAGDFASAIATQLEALSYAEAFEQPSLIAFSSVMAGRVSARAGDWETAVELATAGDRVFAERHVVMYDIDRQPVIELFEAANRVLGDESVRAARRRGEAFSGGDVLAITRRVLTAADHATRAGAR